MKREVEFTFKLANPSNRKGQIWVETVIYTMIAFVMLGAVLAIAKPKIEEIQDKAILEQSVGILTELNNVLLSIEEVPGNQRIVEIGIKKGNLKIDGAEDKIIFEMESGHVYSQPGENVSQGGITVYTGRKGSLNLITLTSDYSEEYNITYNEQDDLKTISKSPTPYTLSISNEEIVGDKATINFMVN